VQLSDVCVCVFIKILIIKLKLVPQMAMGEVEDNQASQIEKVRIW
jgi:hypothetical protein